MRVIFSLVVLVAAAYSWDYSKKSVKGWEFDYPMCGYVNLQSPIEIHTDEKKNIYKGNKFLANMQEDHHTSASVQVTYEGPFIRIHGFADDDFILEGHPEDSVIYTNYHLHHVDFKWGGSEHKVSGKRAEGEVQLFFAKDDPEEYGTDYIGVVVLLTKGSKQNNNAYQQLVLAVKDNLNMIGDTTNILAFDAGDFLHSKSLKEYYYYEGLIPHPPCDKSVTWIISSDKKSLSSKQWKHFEDLEYVRDEDGKKIKKHYRSTQPTGARGLFNSFEDGKLSSKEQFEQLFGENSGSSTASDSDFLSIFFG
jgi:carbonic anhydrase